MSATEAETGLLVECLRRMYRIRIFDTTLSQRDDLPSVGHMSVGMEASIVGACMALEPDDYMVGTHRSHGHPIGKGADIRPLAAEMLGKRTGVNQGKGGSMHLSDFSVGSLGETSIVGSGLPVATGAGLGIKMKGESRVSLCFFGDGAANEGTFHESLNLASIWHLPVVYVCENNQYGEFTAHTDACAVRRISDRAAGYSMPGETVDGMDVTAVYAAVKGAVDRARAGGGPSLVETDTYRFFGHAGGADRSELYRTRAEVDRWRERDPLDLLRARLLAAGIGEQDVDAIEAAERVRVDEAWEFALASPLPDPQDAYLHVFADPIPLS